MEYERLHSYVLPEISNISLKNVNMNKDINKNKTLNMLDHYPKHTRKPIFNPNIISNKSKIISTRQTYDTYGINYNKRNTISMLPYVSPIMNKSKNHTEYTNTFSTILTSSR